MDRIDHKERPTWIHHPPPSIDLELAPNQPGAAPIGPAMRAVMVGGSVELDSVREVGSD